MTPPPAADLQPGRDAVPVEGVVARQPPDLLAGLELPEADRAGVVAEARLVVRVVDEGRQPLEDARRAAEEATRMAAASSTPQDADKN